MLLSIKEQDKLLQYVSLEMLNFLNYVFVIFFKTTSLNIILEMHFFVHNIFDLWIILTYFTYLSFIVNICQNPFFATIILIGKKLCYSYFKPKIGVSDNKKLSLVLGEQKFRFHSLYNVLYPKQVINPNLFFSPGFCCLSSHPATNRSIFEMPFTVKQRPSISTNYE